MSVWLIIGIVTVAAAVLAVWSPRIQVDSAGGLGWLAHDFAPGDDAGRATAQAAAFRAGLPLAVLSAVATVVGLIVSGFAPWSGITSLVGLLLAGASFLAGASAGRRALARRPGATTS